MDENSGATLASTYLLYLVNVCTNLMFLMFF